MKNKGNQKMYNLIHQIRELNLGGVVIKTRDRIVIYGYQTEENLMENDKIITLCREFGFVRQAEIR